MADILEKVGPGDLITADTINQIFAELKKLEVRVAELETGGGGGEEPAIGFIDISHKGGTRGTKIVPGDPKPFPQTFGIINATNKMLRLKLAATITAPNGNWKGAAVFENGLDTVYINVPSEKQVNLDVLVTAPTTAAIGDTAKLTVQADAGPPHNKHGETFAELLVALAPGPPVTQTLELGPITFPIDFKPPDLPSGVDGRIPKTKERSIVYPFKYDTQDPSVDPGFEFSVVFSNANPPTVLSKWSAAIGGAVPDEDQTDPANGTRTIKKKVVLTPALFTNVSLKLIAPNVDSRLKVAVSIRSTKLSSELKKEAQPIVTESK